MVGCLRRCPGDGRDHAAGGGAARARVGRAGGAAWAAPVLPRSARPVAFVAVAADMDGARWVRVRRERASNRRRWTRVLSGVRAADPGRAPGTPAAATLAAGNDGGGPGDRRV